MIVSTTENVPGREVAEILGLVTGNIVQAKHIGRDIQAGLREYRRRESGRLHRNALRGPCRSDCADGRGRRSVSTPTRVVNVRYTTSAISDGMSEILAYGTAVKLR